MLTVIIRILAPVQWSMSWKVTNPGKWGITLYDNDDLTIMFQEPQARSKDGTLTSDVPISRIEFATESSDGFTARFTIEEDGNDILKEYTCADCHSDMTCMTGLNVDNSFNGDDDEYADCVGSCSFVRQSKY